MSVVLAKPAPAAPEPSPPPLPGCRTAEPPAAFLPCVLRAVTASSPPPTPPANRAARRSWWPEANSARSGGCQRSVNSRACRRFGVHHLIAYDVSRLSRKRHSQHGGTRARTPGGRSRGVPRGTPPDHDPSLAELAALAETAGSQVLEGMVQRRSKPDASTYIGSGKAKELREVALATGADTVICDGELSPAQLTALEKAVKVKVIDRTALILDIFAQHATSREGKAQVALAQMEYMLPRLRGWGESMSRQGGGARRGRGGGRGLRGPGETKIEPDRRRIRERMSRLRRDIKDMKQARDTKRSRRLHSDIASVAIVG